MTRDAVLTWDVAVTRDAVLTWGVAVTWDAARPWDAAANCDAAFPWGAAVACVTHGCHRGREITQLPSPAHLAALPPLRSRLHRRL